LLLGIGVSLTGSVVGGAIGLATAWGLVLFGWDFRNGRLILNNSSPQKEEEDLLGADTEPANSKNPLYPRWDATTLSKLVLLALPLGFVMMLISLNTNIPRYFIERYLGERELGIFAAISYLMVAGQMVVSALAESASPRLAKYYAAGNSTAFRTLLLKLVGVGLMLGAMGVFVAVVAGRPILTLLYKPEYAERSDLFAWLMVAAGMGYVSSFLGYGMTAARYFQVQMPLFVLVTGSSAIACFWLIPTQGVRGAAIALIIGAIVQAVFSLGVIVHALYQLNRYQGTKSNIE
ncbi:MAG: lipopolysaccharide biosynthesis protein, partial [Microcoleus sp.]